MGIPLGVPLGLGLGHFCPFSRVGPERLELELLGIVKRENRENDLLGSGNFGWEKQLQKPPKTHLNCTHQTLILMEDMKELYIKSLAYQMYCGWKSPLAKKQI